MYTHVIVMIPTRRSKQKQHFSLTFAPFGTLLPDCMVGGGFVPRMFLRLNFVPGLRPGCDMVASGLTS